MLPRIAPGDPGTAFPPVIDGHVLSLIPAELDITPEPVGDYVDMLDGGAREFQRRPGFDGVANHSDRYTIDLVYDSIKGTNREQMELIRARGGLHRVTVWRMVPVIYTCQSGVQRYYFPRFRKCAAHLYSGLNIGGNITVSTDVFPTLATLNDDDLIVTYALGPTLVTPGAGGLVIAKQPDTSGAATDYTALMLGDVVATGDELIVWTCFTFECSMRAPRIPVRGITESHSHTFVEV